MKIITGEITDFDGALENVGNISIGYLSQIYTDNENKTVREEIKDGFKDIIATEIELNKVEKEMNEHPENMEIIERYTTLLEKFNNIGGYNYNNLIHNVANGMQILHLLFQVVSDDSKMRSQNYDVVYSWHQQTVTVMSPNFDIIKI